MATSDQLLKTRFFSSKLATHIKFKSRGGPVWLHKERSPSHVTELVTFGEQETYNKFGTTRIF